MPCAARCCARCQQAPGGLIQAPGRLRHAGAAARHHQHAGLGTPTQQAQQADPVDAGQHQVEDVEIEAEGAVASQQVVAVGKPGHRHAPGLQELGKVFTEGRVVIDQRRVSGSVGVMGRLMRWR